MSSIYGIAVSNSSDEVLIHVPADYDFHLLIEDEPKKMFIYYLMLAKHCVQGIKFPKKIKNS